MDLQQNNTTNTAANAAVALAAAIAAFNLADFEARDTAWLDVQNIKGDGPLLVGGLPVRIEIRSPGTREAVQAQHKLDTASTTRTYAAMRGKQVKETPESKLAEKAEKLAAVTARIENFPVQPQDIYTNPKLGWLTDQVAAFHGDWANF